MRHTNIGGTVRRAPPDTAAAGSEGEGVGGTPSPCIRQEPGSRRDDRAEMIDVIVAGSHLRYDGVWQRPHHVLTRLARHVPVLVVEEQYPSAKPADEVASRGAVSVLRPFRARPATGVDGPTLDAVAAWCAGRSALVWLYTPMLLAIADRLAEAPVVYDCMDDLGAFAFAPPEMDQHERALFERADVVFAGGRSLYERCRGRTRDAVLCPSGVEFAHFSRARTEPPHPALAGLERPIFGYFGVVDERIDLDILAEIGRRRRTAVIVGPVAKIDPAGLPAAPTLHYTGQVEYADLPSYLAGFDVAMLPFALNRATASISPTKTPEYLAGARPVVSTPIADVVADYGGLVRVAQGPRAFADACAHEARWPDRERIARGVERARELGWDEIVERMWAHIGDRRNTAAGRPVRGP